MSFDADTLNFALTYGGTLILALLMFVGQLSAAAVLLVLSGIVGATVFLVQRLAWVLTKQGRP